MKKIWQKLIVIFMIMIIIFNLNLPIINSVQAVNFQEDVFFSGYNEIGDGVLGTLDGIVRSNNMDT